MQGIEYVRQPDTVHLLLLTTRIASLGDVQGAGFYDRNQASIVESGDMAMPVKSWQEFSTPVAIGADVLATARVRLKAEAFSPGLSDRQWLATVALLVLTPLLTMVLAELIVMRKLRKSLPIVEIEDEEEPELQPRWLVIGNFYNQFSFPGDVRRTIQERILPKAVGVAELYQGRGKTFSAGGLLLEFDAGEDTSFKALCAARLLSDVLDASDPDVEYRFALHRVMASPRREIRPELLADAALLAALAPDDSLIASHDFMTALEQPERCVAEAVDHPMLVDITSINGPAFCIRGVNAPHGALLNRQVEAMLGHSTVMASTR